MALIGEMKYLLIGSNTYEIPISELPIASSSTLGGIKVGSGLTIDSTTGILSVTGIPTKVSDLTNDAGYITDYTETDPTVPTWAKASTKPTYTASEVGALPSTTTYVSSVNGDSGDVTLSIPTISITRNLTSGTKSATINISGTDYDIYSATPPLAATTAPVVDGTAAVGSSSKYAKEDHVHPTDTSRAATTTVATLASINSTGLITYKNSGGTSLFTLLLPLYNGGVS